MTDAVFDQLRQLDWIERARDADEHHGKGVDVEFVDARPDDVVGQFADFILEGGAQLDRRRIKIGSPFKDDIDPAATVATISSMICVIRRSITSGLAPS
jgi:hypothetical protein